jgi:predicted DNA-binding transcriptional regulator AlpA
MPLTIKTADCAQLLGKTVKTFRYIRPALEGLGFPLPLKIPGQPIWSEQEVVEWVLSRSPNSPRVTCVVPVPNSVPVEPPPRRGRGRPRKNPVIVHRDLGGAA